MNEVDKDMYPVPGPIAHAAVPGTSTTRGPGSTVPDVQAVVKTILEARAQALLPNQDVSTLSAYYDQAYMGQGIVGASLLAYEQDKIREFQAWAAKKNQNILNTKVELTFKQVQTAGNTAKVQVTENLRFNWVYLNKPDAVMMSGLGIDHDGVGYGRWPVADPPR